MRMTLAVVVVEVVKRSGTMRMMLSLTDVDGGTRTSSGVGSTSTLTFCRTPSTTGLPPSGLPLVRGTVRRPLAVRGTV